MDEKTLPATTFGESTTTGHVKPASANSTVPASEKTGDALVHDEKPSVVREEKLEGSRTSIAGTSSNGQLEKSESTTAADAAAAQLLADEEDMGAHYVHGWKLYCLSLGLCITTFLIGLDQSILATVCLRGHFSDQLLILFEGYTENHYAVSEFGRCWMVRTDSL
jgi:hypothetical protein